MSATSKLKVLASSMIAITDIAMATSPKSAGTSSRARTVVLATPTQRSNSRNSTIHAAPRAISRLITDLPPTQAIQLISATWREHPAFTGLADLQASPPLFRVVTIEGHFLKLARQIEAEARIHSRDAGGSEMQDRAHHSARPDAACRRGAALP